jgi:CrcB protein
MGQILALAIGGATGSVLRYFVANGVYQWLGRGFPYGTLAVNIIGSLLIGLLTEALILQRIAMTLEFRTGILVGFIGAFTTFSTFSLETLFLLEQGNFLKALLNVVASVSVCLFATWIGLLTSRTLFLYSGGVIRWLGWTFPYAIVTVNAIVAFLLGLITALLLHKTALPPEDRATIMVILAGAFTTLSGLYLVLYLIEEGHRFEADLNAMLAVFIANASVCIGALWLGLAAGRQI